MKAPQVGQRTDSGGDPASGLIAGDEGAQELWPAAAQRFGQSQHRWKDRHRRVTDERCVYVIEVEDM
jgi:hypothetical protein